MPKTYKLEDIMKDSLDRAQPFFTIPDKIEVGVLVLSPGKRLPDKGYSVHDKSHEMAIVLDGEIHFYTDRESIVLRKNDFLYNPPGTPHYIINKSNKETKILWFVSPPI